MPWSDPVGSEALFRADGGAAARPLFSAERAEARPLDPDQRGSGAPAATHSAAPANQRAEDERRSPPGQPLTDEELQAQVAAFRAAERAASEAPLEADMVPRALLEERSAERDALLREREVLQRQLHEREEHLATSIGALDAAARTLRDGAAEAVVRLATLIARRVTERELETDGELAADLAERAMRKLDGFAGAEVRVHPTDYGAVRARLERNAEGREGPVIRVTADGDVDRGGCVVTTEGAEVDARMETQFERLEEGLLEAMTAAVARPLHSHASAKRERDVLDAIRATER